MRYCAAVGDLNVSDPLIRAILFRLPRSQAWSSLPRRRFKGSSYFFPPQGRNTSSPKNACVGGYIQDCCFMLWQKFLRKITLNKNLFNILDSVNRNDDKLLRTQVETVKPRAMNFLGKSRTRDRRHHCVISLFHTALMDHSSWPISLTLSSKSCTCVKESYSSN